MKREVPLIHPGEILLKDWLEPLGMSQYDCSSTTR